MIKKYLLPPLRQQPEIKDEKCWSKMEKAYDYLLDNLKLYYEPAVSVFEGGSNAIPHIYEQMLVFHKAFMDSNDKEHNRAVIEWKAVLSIMALQRIFNLQVDVIKIDLSTENKTSFLKAAAIFVPEEQPVFHGTTWDFLYVLCWRGVPIAIFSPITIVCPAKQFKKKIRDMQCLRIECVNGVEQLLFDFSMNGNEYTNLGDWLDRLEKKLVVSGNNNGEIFDKYNKVISELQYFKSICHQEAAQGHKTLFETSIYSSINNSIRREYGFLNNCCDFYVSNKKMRFLIKRYREDIFQENLLILRYDEDLYFLDDNRNAEKLEKLFHSVLKISGKSIMQIRKHGGEPVSAFAFLPFKENLVKELMENKITPDEFFEEFTVIYNAVSKCIEVKLRIKEFPYDFTKIYPEQRWSYIDKRDVCPVYIWPGIRMDAYNWNIYYTYVETGASGADLDIPNAKEKIRYEAKDEFEIIRTDDFPAYLKYSCDKTYGYLPIQTEHATLDDIGNTAVVFVDAGHATTSVSIVKTDNEKLKSKPERIQFQPGDSLMVAGEVGNTDHAKYNFALPLDQMKVSADRYFKNIIHNFRLYNQIPESSNRTIPFKNGVILFDEDCFRHENDKSLASFINFEYKLMNQEERENVHIFIEQILLYAVYQAMRRKCSYIRVNFLHSYYNNNEKLGELCGLWEHALDRVVDYTGIRKSIDNPIGNKSFYEALANHTYYEMIKDYRENPEQLSKEHVYVGIDIGWKNTWMTCISWKDMDGEKDKGGVQADFARIKYAGRDISLLNGDYAFIKYPEMLSILLSGSTKINNDVEELIHEFRGLYSGSGEKGNEYYQGIFDAIAMKVEQNNFVSPPDVYNNMIEFRAFIKMITYNLMLLFLNIGYLMGKQKRGKNIHIFLGGNGAKFIKWISNEKSYTVINRENSKKIWILELKKNILDIICEGYSIKDKCNIETITITLIEDSKEQMVEGYAFDQIPELYECDEKKLDFQYSCINNTFDDNDGNSFRNTINEMCEDVFGSDFLSSKGDMDERKTGQDISEMIRMNKRVVCEKMIAAIDAM